LLHALPSFAQRAADSRAPANCDPSTPNVATTNRSIDRRDWNAESRRQISSNRHFSILIQLTLSHGPGVERTAGSRPIRLIAQRSSGVDLDPPPADRDGSCRLFDPQPAWRPGAAGIAPLVTHSDHLRAIAEAFP
jgi:hypothetical protein